MKLSLTYFIGIGLFGLVMGYLVGASNTPVVGAVLAALVPVATALGSMFGKFKLESAEIDNSNVNLNLTARMIGWSLAVFSVLLFVGLLSGEYHRRYDLLRYLEKRESRDSKPFPWSYSEIKPDTLEEAIIWIKTQEQLLRLGYEQDSIENLYKLNPRIINYSSEIDLGLSDSDDGDDYGLQRGELPPKRPWGDRMKAREEFEMKIQGHQ